MKREQAGKMARFGFDELKEMFPEHAEIAYHAAVPIIDSMIASFLNAISTCNNGFGITFTRKVEDVVELVFDGEIIDCCICDEKVSKSDLHQKFMSRMLFFGENSGLIERLRLLIMNGMKQLPFSYWGKLALKELQNVEAEYLHLDIRLFYQI